MANPSRSRSSTLLALALVLYGVALTVYAIYSSMTAQGFAGYLITKQMDFFGGASITITFVLVLIVFGLPSYLLAAIVGVTVWPALGEAMFGPVRASAPVKAVPPQPAAPPTRMRWSTVVKTALVLFALTGAISSVLYFLNIREQNLGVYKLDLDRNPGPLPGRLGFVRLTGHLDRSHASSYSDKTNIYLVVPVTDASWRPNTPLQYFLIYQQLGSSGTKFSLPAEFRQPGAAEFTGRFSGRLPAFIQSEYTKKGLKMAPDYRILQYESISESGSPISDSHTVALIVGGIISVALIAAMVGAKLKGM